MAHNLTPDQLNSLETIERVASCLSLLGTSFIFVTFIYSPAFRKPINRLMFYASIGNSLCNVGTLISLTGIRAGPNSHICQFQGFLIQFFLPADALWNLAMAINVYMTLFRRYNADQLKALEWKYRECFVYTSYLRARRAESMVLAKASSQRSWVWKAYVWKDVCLPLSHGWGNGQFDSTSGLVRHGSPDLGLIRL